MTDRDRWGLRGPVHVCRLRRTWYSRRCDAKACEAEEGGDTTEVEFRADGSLGRRWHHNPDGSEWTSTYEYDDLGRLRTLRTEDAAGVANVQFYEYDTAGRLARVMARPKDGGDRIVESYEYDAAGRKKKTAYVELTTQQPNTCYGWAVEGTDSIYSAPGAATLSTLYNDRDQPAELLFCDAAGRPLSRVEFRYDDVGNLIEEAQTNLTEALPSEMLKSLNQAQLEAVRALLGAAGQATRRIHSYDEHGRRVETRWRMGLLAGERKTVAYNDRGDPVEEVSEHDRRGYAIDDEGRLSDTPTRGSVSCSQARFRYDYDAHSNWLTKTVESRGGPDRDFTLSSVERRAIEYFG
jgi:hypothetical protein